MLTMEKLAEKWPFSAGGWGSSDRSPLGYGPVEAHHSADNCLASWLCNDSVV